MIRMHVIRMTPNEERRGEGLVMSDHVGPDEWYTYEQSEGGPEQLQSALNRLAARVNRLLNSNKGA